MLIVIGGEKGGTGKTTITTNLAVCLARNKRDVMLVDADPQPLSAKWASRRAEMIKAHKLNLPTIRWCELRGDAMFDQLSDFAERYQDVVVDIAGADSVEFRSALSAADRLYSPMVPSDLDLSTAQAVDELVGNARAIGNKKLKAYVVLNRCPSHHLNEEIAEMREALAEYGNLRIAETHLSDRKAFRTAYRSRVGVIELHHSPDNSLRIAAAHAAREFENLCDEIMGTQRFLRRKRGAHGA